jgi:hypothetical protein
MNTTSPTLGRVPSILDEILDAIIFITILPYLFYCAHAFLIAFHSICLNNKHMPMMPEVTHMDGVYQDWLESQVPRILHANFA